jgi:prepilin-type N-terminal cleavage/methylation domain-containing protein
MRGIKNSNNGFTIVELIVAMFVGAALVGSVNLIYTTQTYLSQEARDAAMSNSFAEGKFEALRSQGYLALANGTTSVTSELPSELGQPRSASLQITTPSTGVKRAVLVISYNQKGATATKTYTTFIGELGVGQQ